MSHELEQNADGTYNFCFVGERKAIWHRLGKEIPDDLTALQTMEAANLNWTVDKVPLFANVGDKSIDTGHAALVRSSDDRVLDVVTNTWNPVQNEQAFEFFHEFVQAGDMKMNTAGSLKNGKIVWALAKVADGFSLFDGKDVVEGYLLFSNPHQFGKSVDIRFVQERVVCHNTLSMALAEVSENQVRHSHRSKFDPERVKQVLGLASNRMAVYKEQATFLASKKAKTEDVVEYFKRVFPVLTQKTDSKKEMSKQAARALEIVDTQPGAEYGAGTWWSQFNAATYLTSNEIGKTDDNRLTSLWYGQSAQRNARAMTLALEYANA